MQVDLRSAFSDLASFTSDVENNRREEFYGLIRRIVLGPDELYYVFSGYGFGMIFHAFYFVLFHYFRALNLQRGDFLDDALIHMFIIRILNDCAADDFGSLYDLLFS